MIKDLFAMFHSAAAFLDGWSLAIEKRGKNSYVRSVETQSSLTCTKKYQKYPWQKFMLVLHCHNTYFIEYLG